MSVDLRLSDLKQFIVGCIAITISKWKKKCTPIIDKSFTEWELCVWKSHLPEHLHFIFSVIL